MKFPSSCVLASLQSSGREASFVSWLGWRCRTRFEPLRHAAVLAPRAALDSPHPASLPPYHPGLRYTCCHSSGCWRASVWARHAHVSAFVGRQPSARGGDASRRWQTKAPGLRASVTAKTPPRGSRDVTANQRTRKMLMRDVIPRGGQSQGR
ncbi:hypothetical protein E2C01_088862 [Portunus trituberculatus]|uniref:Uncharacterized protein n=1 Tax=Portunus trituberculatus TaxID=210409 RepID=A0A5B7JBZ0_PORTR|nr:hypothetical protein [Portunus trituberculatus]